MSNKLRKNNNEGQRKLIFGFKTIKLEDKSGKKLKVRELTWTDLAILTNIKGIKCSAFLSYIRDQDDIFWAIFTDAFNHEGPDVYYAVKLGDYNAVTGSYINHDSEETADLWEKMTPDKEVKIE